MSGTARRGRAVADTYISYREMRDSGLRDWLRDLPKAHRLDGYKLVDAAESGIGWAEPVHDPLPAPAPSTHRTGTCFDVESTEMREACVDSLQRYLGAETVIHEVRHQRSAYHTDLVYGCVHYDALDDRVNMAVGDAPLHDPLQRFRVWWYVHENGPMARGKAIDDGRYADASKNRKHVTWLLEHGYLGRTATDHVVAAVPPKIADLHAVELKLRDWEKALEQADRANRYDGPDTVPEKFRDRYGYADYRWVALDAGAINAALENREAFRERGVGLLAVAEGGAVVEHIPAEHEPRVPYTRDRAYVESQVWNRVDLGDYASRVGEREGGGGETSGGDGAQPSLAAFGGGGFS